MVSRPFYLEISLFYALHRVAIILHKVDGFQVLRRSVNVACSSRNQLPGLRQFSSLTEAYETGWSNQVLSPVGLQDGDSLLSIMRLVIFIFGVAEKIRKMGKFLWCGNASGDYQAIVLQLNSRCLIRP